MTSRLALVVALALTLPASAPAFAGANGRIAFTSDRDGNSEIYSANPNAGDVFRLTNDPSADQSPSFSPDGKRLAFASFREGRQKIFLMDALPSPNVPTRLSPDDLGMSDDATPAWSPDGTKVAFASTRPFGQNWAIWVVNLDGSDLHRVGPGYDPAWSPDGTKLAYLGADASADGNAIFVMNADGSSPHRLTAGTTPEDQPAWSPDGREIAFGRYRADWRTSNVHQLFVAATEGGTERQLTATNGYDGNPSWSPDGRKLVFQRSNNGFVDLRTINADGSGLQPYLVGAGSNFTPDWGVAPDQPPPPPPGDTTPPRIVVAVPGYDQTYLLGQHVAASYNCRDDDGPPAPVELCDATVGDVHVANGGPLDTSSVGTKWFTVTARDKAGNVSYENRTYRVIYDFSGFANPLASFPTVNAWKAGEGVPVRFSLAGDHGLGVLPPGTPASFALPCESMPEQNGGDGVWGSLSYKPSPDRYMFLWKTEKAWAGSCRQLIVELDDGTRHFSNFRFTK